MNSFKDHFSTQAKIYADARPTYPKELFDFIFSICKNKNLAWDCATGNGQTAISLCENFENIIATDGSELQLENAFKHPKVLYKKAYAENADFIENDSVDLITVSTALHWFDENLFFEECKRVLKNDGVLAIWSYFGNTIDQHEINKIVNDFAYETLIDYWPLGAKKNWIDQYKDVQLPFEKIESPQFIIEKEWNYFQYINYMNSWSAVNEYIKKHQSNPLEMIDAQLKNLWGDLEKTYLCTWHLVSFFSIKK